MVAVAGTHGRIHPGTAGLSLGEKNRRRLLREVRGLFSILFRGLKARRPDVVFSASSPPCLLVVAALIAARHRAKSAHWLMDLYPELALALGEVKPGFISSLIERLMGWAYRRTDLLVALDEDMADRLKKQRVSAGIIQPWVSQSLQKASPKADAAPDSEWTWIYSGNLGRAHEWETLLQVQSLLEERNLPGRLLFQGGGPSWPLAQARARELGLRRCDWKNYADEAELQSSLLRCRVLVVTQRPETQGLLWPSKLALVGTLPRPILWVGPVDGAIARQLRKLPQAGIFAPGKTAQIAGWLQSLYNACGTTITAASPDAAQQRMLSLEKWGALLSKL